MRSSGPQRPPVDSWSPGVREAASQNDWGPFLLLFYLFYFKTQEKSEENSYVKPDFKTVGMLTGQAGSRGLSNVPGNSPSFTEVLFIERTSWEFRGQLSSEVPRPQLRAEQAAPADPVPSWGAGVPRGAGPLGLGWGSGPTHPSHQVACPEPCSPSLACLMMGSSWGSDAGSGGDSRGTVLSLLRGPPSLAEKQSGRCIHGPFQVHRSVTDQLGHCALGRTRSPLVGAERVNASGIRASAGVPAPHTP